MPKPSLKKRIPITLLSGYLGAGKTTIINRLLSSDHGRRIAVLVNDFGAINIDASLIETEEKDRISLTNGCVCCTIGDNLGASLDMQAARSDPPDHILLEASGVAEPKRIAMHAGFWPGFELDALIVAVDATTVRNRVDDKFVGQLVRSQIQSAEIIALTKVDLCDPKQTQEMTDFIYRIDPEARIIRTVDGALPIELAFGSRSEPGSLRGPLPEASHLHLASQLWEPTAPLCRDALTKALQALPGSVHRIKGFFRDAETGQMTLLQGVGSRHNFEDAAPETQPAIVLIGVGRAKEMAAAMGTIKACISATGP